MNEEKKNETDKKSEENKCLGANCDFFKKNLDYIIGGIIIIALVVSLVFIIVKKENNDVVGDDVAEEEITGKKVSKKVSEKIENKLTVAFDERFAPEAEVVFNEIREESKLYKIYMTIDGNDFEVYLTKDYNKFLPQVIDLDELLEEIEGESKIDLSVENKKALGFAENSKPRLDYFVMSFCPYGNPADENASKIHAVFGDSVEVVPHYIVNLDEKNGYNSLHGVQEAHQDIRELCVLENYGKDKFFEFTLTSNEKLTDKNADAEWQAVAWEVGVDVNIIANCEQSKGLEIAKREMEVSNNTKVKGQNGAGPISGSPTMLVNGEKVGNSASVIQEALCESFGEGERPVVCDQDIESAEAASGSCN